nr:RecName: Full=Unknown protein NF019 from 2D-PAGE [Naegleria fowleri]
KRTKAPFSRVVKFSIDEIRN